MLSQSTSLKARDLEGTGTAVRPSLKLVPDVDVRQTPTVDLSTVMAVPDRKVCLGCGMFGCSTPAVCTRVVATMVLKPCTQCRGVGAVRVQISGGASAPGFSAPSTYGFAECDPCDGLGMVTADGAVIELGGAA